MPDSDNGAVEVKYETTIDGKLVHFRERLTSKNAPDMYRRLQTATTEDTATMIALLVKVIDRWEFDGDPTQPKAYDDLDIIDHLIPMTLAVTNYINQRQARLADLKN